jgi:DNA-binding Lrp family transcriptional regulator
LENVFDVGAEVTTGYSAAQTFGKTKRSAFIFITTDSEPNALALEDLRKIDEVKEVYVAHGAYDIVARVSGESFESLREIVHNRIRNLSGIKSTLTLTIV